MAKGRRFRKLDEIDGAIVRSLQERGRDSFAEIGKVVGLSATSVAERVRRLESSGIVRAYRASVSAEKLGFGLMAFILARPIGPDARFAKRASERPEILECYRVTGDVSFVAKAVVSDVKHLEEVLDYLEPATSYVETLLVLSTPFERAIPVGTQPRRVD